MRAIKVLGIILLDFLLSVIFAVTIVSSGSVLVTSVLGLNHVYSLFDIAHFSSNVFGMFSVLVVIFILILLAIIVFLLLIMRQKQVLKTVQL